MERLLVENAGADCGGSVLGGWESDEVTSDILVVLDLEEGG